MRPCGGDDPVFNGRANFGFNFTCEVTGSRRGQITYQITSTKVSVRGPSFPGLRLHGTVDNF